jgi:single-stranded-DNA-specific exonuclease
MGIGSFSPSIDYIKTEERYRPGYKALLKQLRLSEEKITSRDMGWSLAPAINAAGRMGRTELALRLLMAQNETEAAELAKGLSDLNKQRKNRTKKNEKIIIKLIEENPGITDEPVIFCYHEDLESGVSGIVANRLTEEYRRPVIYINPDGDYARGSGRSYNQCGILDLIAEGADLLIQHGGHREAAGFSLKYDKIDEFRQRILDKARIRPEFQIFLKDIDYDKKKVKAGIAVADTSDSEHAHEYANSEIPLNSKSADSSPTQPDPEFHIKTSPENLLWSTFSEIQLLEPFGMGNPEPIFFLPGVRIHSLKHLSEGKHVRFRIQGAPAYLEALLWRQGELLDEKKSPFHRFNIYGCLENSFFAGKRALQFRVEAIRVCDK